MAHIHIPTEYTIEEKLKMMEDAARYDIADSEQFSESELRELAAIKGQPAAKKVPKVFLSNDCIFNCSYCCCRQGICEKHRYAHQPREMAEMAVHAAQQNPTQGVFVTSGIYKNSNYTQELIIETIRIMRQELGYVGYLHAKIMPGADPALIEQAGWFADRLSINIELPRSDGYQVIAKQKNKQNILKPMGSISQKILEHQGERKPGGRLFAKGGQTTQMIVGAMQENDRTTLILSQALYHKYRLRRVYYSPFGLPTSEQFDFFPESSTPMWRTRRLYQADRLMQLYGFTADEIVPEAAPDMLFDLDPKAAWALRHLDIYPVEVNRADYDTLLRVPGIGVTYAKRIILARKTHILTHELLLQIGISLKRAQYFITCNGKYIGANMLDSPALRSAVSDKGNQFSLLAEN